MRRGTTVFVAGGLLLLAACTRTVVVNPAPGSAPDRGLRGSRPPPHAPLGPERPADPPPPPPPPVRTFEVLIPPGHLPNPGECRVWIPGRAPGRQPRPRSRPCAGIEAVAPPGSWIVYRRADDPRLVYLRVVDERRPGIVIRNRIFDIDSWELVREEDPRDDPRWDRPRQERPRDDRPPENRPPVQPPAVQPPVVQPPAEQRPPMPPREIIPPVPPPPTQPPPEQRPPENKPPEPPPPPPAAPSNVTLNIPPGHLPNLGECRVWIPLRPPGLQPKPKSRTCDGIIAVAPAGSWIIDRPSAQPKLVYVRLVDPRRAGVVTSIRVFDIDSRRLLREETP